MIIGLIGFKQVGKSTAAKYLEEKYGFVRHNMKDALVAEIKQNFPDLLKEIAKKETDITGGMFLDEAIEALFYVKPPLMRALLQNYGTEVRRGDNDSYWTDQWLKKMNATPLSLPRMMGGKELLGYQVSDLVSIVTDDIRFKNEAEAVKMCKGILIRLTRPDVTTGGSHPSETEQLEIEADYTIECVPGDHEHLYRELDRIVGMVE